MQKFLPPGRSTSAIRQSPLQKTQSGDVRDGLPVRPTMIRLQFAHGRADGPAAGNVGHDLLDHSRIGVSQRTVCRLLDINEGRSALKSRLRFLQAANTYEQARHNTCFRQGLWSPGAPGQI